MRNYEIDEFLVITANTHKVDGSKSDASAINYRIYEEATDTEIVSDTAMTKFDSQTGFYLDREQLTSVKGFEDGKTYTVFITATVDSVDGTDSFQFTVGKIASKSALSTIDTVVDAIKAKTDNLPADPASETNVNANETKIDTIDGIVDAIKTITDNLPNNGALTDIDSKIDTIDGIVDTIKSSTDPLTLVAIADAILSRAISNVEDSAGYRTLAGAVAKLVNKFKRTTTHLEVYKTDDTTKWWQQAITEDEDANPISEIDTE